MKKILLSVVSAVMFLCTGQAQEIYYSQDFESGLPAGWVLEGGFQLTDGPSIASQFYNPGNHTQFVGTNDDGLGASGDGSGQFTTGEIDLSMVTGELFLYFQSFFTNGDYQGNDETAKISVSTDAGATWDELYNLELSGPWQDIAVDMNDYAGQSIWLQFAYDDGNAWNYGWCIDDIRFRTPIQRDASFEALNREAMVDVGMVGGKVYPGGVIRNNGLEMLTSIDLVFSDGTDEVTETLTDLNLSPGGVLPIITTTPLTLSEGTTNFSVSIANANGQGDDENPDNDEGGSFSVTTVSDIHPDRGVLVEEATGTWCQFCPRGAVFMEVMGTRFPGHFVGVAVHNQDPMAVSAYDNALGNIPGFPGYPSALFNRESIMDPSEVVNPFLQRVSEAPVAKLNLGAEFDESTRQLTVSIEGQFGAPTESGYRFGAIIIEDHVTGTASGYNQVNAFAGGGQMGGFEALPSPVPAENMVYDFVGRSLLGGFNGVSGSIPDFVPIGSVQGHVFNTYTIPAAYDLEEIRIVGFLRDENGDIANAMVSTIEEAVASGLFVSSAKEAFNHEALSVYPNPSNGLTNIQLTLEKVTNVSMFAYNALGQMVAQEDYGFLVGENLLPFDGSGLAEGVYEIHVKMDDKLATQQILIAR